MLQFITNIFRTRHLTEQNIELVLENRLAKSVNDGLVAKMKEHDLQYENRVEKLNEREQSIKDKQIKQDSDRSHKWEMDKDKQSLELKKLRLEAEIECEKIRTDTAKDCQKEVEINSAKINGFWERAVAFAANGSDKMLNRFMEFVMADKTVQSDFVEKFRNERLLDSGKTDDIVAEVIETAPRSKK